MIIAIITTFISLMLSLIISKKILAPATIVSAIWLFCILAYWLYPHNYLDLNGQFYIGISLWVGCFSFFSLLRESLSIKDKNTAEPNQLIRNVYFIITLISFPISVFGIFSIIQQHGLSNHLLSGLRSLAIGDLKGLEEGTSNNYFATLWLVTYAIELLHYKKKRLPRIIMLLLINLSWGVMVMAKINFLNLIFTSLAILFFKNVIKPKAIYISIALLFVFFSTFQVIRTVGAKDKDDLTYDFFSLYVLSGMPAFEKTHANSSEYWGKSTFRFFYKVGEKIGITDHESEKALLPFINIGKKNPTHTNIYTTLYPFYKDFGYYGIAIFAALVGFFYGFLFKGLMNRNNALLITYSILSASLVIQFMSENTFSTMSFVIQILFLSHLPYWGNSFFRS